MRDERDGDFCGGGKGEASIEFVWGRVFFSFFSGGGGTLGTKRVSGILGGWAVVVVVSLVVMAMQIFVWDLVCLLVVEGVGVRFLGGGCRWLQHGVCILVK